MEEKWKPGLTTVSDLLEGDTNIVVNVSGRVTFQGPKETVLFEGKTLWKQEAIFTDNTETIRLVLWENDIARIASTSLNKILRIVLHEYEKAKYLTLNKMSNNVFCHA